GLLPVVLGHRPSARGPETLHEYERFLVGLEAAAEDLGGDLGGEIVDGRAEAAGADDDVDRGAELAEGGLEDGTIVADGDVADDPEAEASHLLGELGRVGVDDLTSEHLVARREDGARQRAHAAPVGEDGSGAGAGASELGGTGSWGAEPGRVAS